MPKYLIKASYTSEGVKGLVKDGGGKRKKAAQAVVQSVGGKLESFYFALGSDDAYVILDAPDNASVVAANMAINATGLVHSQTVVLLTPEEMDKAAKKSPKYRAPGQ